MAMPKNPRAPLSVSFSGGAAGLTQVAHDDHKADDDGENGLEEFVPNANQEACADEGSEKCRQEQLQKDFFV